MNINSTNMQALRTTYSAAFQGGLDGAESQMERVATTVPSANASNTYGWLGEGKGIREWIGDRHVHRMAEHDYTIKNKKYERTEEVDRDSIEDDTFGIYTPLMADMGHDAQMHPDNLVWTALGLGFTAACFDGQYFFDADHLGYNGKGKEISVSNMQAGAEAPWFLMNTRRPLKPLIFQQRKLFDFVAKDNPTDDNVFDRATFKYGIDGRSNAGYGLWQMAFGSKAVLTEQNYNAAQLSMSGIKKASGEPGGVSGNLLVVGRSNKAAAKKLFEAQLINGGESNTLFGDVEVLAVDWLD